MALPARCSVRSEALGEPIFGTASTVRRWLLVEHPGPWGRHPLLDARLPRGIAEGLRRIDDSLGVRVLLIRRPGRSPRAGTRCYAIRSGPGECWIRSTMLESITDVLDLDVVALSEGRDPGLDPASGPLFLVCTHGRRDPCCAERGRPLARALAEADPDATWECTHVGGDRFAGNVVAFPHGLYFGRVAPSEAAALARSYRRARIELAHFRGRSCDPMIVQAAEHFLRERRDLLGVDDVRPVGVRRRGAQVTVRFETPADTVDVSLERRRTESRLLTCHADQPVSAPSYRLLAIDAERSSDAGA
jgi:hypothetical protein